MATIPNDVLKNILLRLPLKTIGRFRCVCEPWLSLINTTDFTKSYIDQANLINGGNATHLMVTRGPLARRDYSKQIFYSINPSKFIQPVTDLTHHLPRMDVFVTVVGSCNGLLCLSDFQNFVSLWNPITREYVKLVSGLWFEESSTKTHTLIGFGCDLDMEEYKVLLLRIELYDGPGNSDTSFSFVAHEAQVYTLGTNSCELIQDSSSSPFPLLMHEKYGELVHLKGSLHWLARRIDTSCSMITFFDLKSEEFGEIPLPDPARALNLLKLTTLMGHLSIYFNDKFDCLEIWVLKDYKVKGSWTRLGSIRDHAGRFLQPLILCKNDEVLVLDGHVRLRFYNPLDESLRVLRIPLCAKDHALMVSYVESYVSIKSLMPIEIAEEEETRISKVINGIARVCNSFCRFTTKQRLVHLL